ncbi:p1177c; B1177_F1_12 [Cronobacter malonaticus 681]|nr:p1177c; B1177_F1_12 [Cronobacter malonaticus 681]
MDVVGKIQRCGACGQIDDIAFRGKHVDTIVKDLTAQFVEHLAGIRHLFLPGDKFTQPGDTVFMTVTHAACRAFFVLPVRRHAEFSVFVHLFGADLNFHGFAARAKHHGMNGLVAVGFRVGDIIVELIRQMAIVRVNYPECGVAVLKALCDDAHGAHVKKLIKRQMLFLHFAPDAVDMFWTAVNLRLNAFFFHGAAQMRHKLVDIMLAVYAPLMQQLCDTLVLFGVQIAEAEILQLPLELADAKTVRQRRIDIGALFRRKYAFIFRRVFHLAQMRDALCEFNHHAAEIIDHRQ